MAHRAGILQLERVMTIDIMDDVIGLAPYFLFGLLTVATIISIAGLWLSKR